MMQTESLNVRELIKQKQAKILTLSVPTSSEQETSNVYLNFYPGYKGIDLSPANRKIIQSITMLFESWQTWQRHILFSGLVHRFSKTQLKNLKTAIESLCHRDFVAICGNVYPMHKVKERQHVYYRDLSKHEKRELALSSTRFLAGSTVNIERVDSGSKFELKNYFGKKLKKRKSQKLSSDEKISRERAQTSPAISQGVPLKKHVENDAHSRAMPTGSRNVCKKSSMISLPSVWEMGPGVEEISDDDSDFQSRVSQVNKPPTDYFPQISSHNDRGKFVTTSSKIGLNEYMTRFNADRNKMPWPTTPQLYKNQKLWSTHHHTVNSTANRLKELFQKQMNQIWKWVEGWQEHKRMRLLLHLLSISLAQEQKFVADCIREKIKEIRAEESLAAGFPQRVWMNIIDYLNLGDVEKSERVCKAWHLTLTDDDLWIKKCKEMGKKLKIDNLIQLIYDYGRKNEKPDWRQIYFTLREFAQRKIDAKQKDSDAVSSDIIVYLHSKLDEKLDVAADTAKLVKTTEKIKRIEKEKASFFSSFKSELKARRDEEKVRAKMVKEEEEMRRREEAARRLRELKKKRREQIEKIMYDVRPMVSERQSAQRPSSKSEVRFADAAPMRAMGRTSFLNMWDNIYQDIKEKDDKKRKKMLTQKTFVNVFDTLLTDEELASASKTVGFFAIDHTEEETQSTKPWIVDTYVPPIGTVVALQGHVRPVWCILFHGSRVISGGMDRKIRFWTISGDCYATMDEVAKGGIRSMAIGTDERCRTLYASSWDTTVIVLDSITLKKTAVLVGHKDTVSGVAVDNNYLVSCSYDCTIRVWDVKDNRLLRVVQHHDKPLLCLALKDGLIFTGGVDRILHLTEAKTGHLLKSYVGHKSAITAVKVRKNLIVTGDLEGYIFFWSLKGADKPVSTVRAHQKKVNAIEFSEHRLFTASDDKQVKEWNLFTLRCLRTLQGHSRAVMDIKFTGDYLITCSKDGTVRMWWWLKHKEGKGKKERRATAP